MSKVKLSIFFLLITTVLTGCVSFSSSEKKKKQAAEAIPPDGGFYTLGRDAEKNYVWSQDVYLSTTEAQKPSFKDVDIITTAIDPQDDKAFYVGTKSNGLYYTYDAGKNWFTVEKFKKEKIVAIGLSYFNKCLIYVATPTQLFRSEDCSRNWTQTYNETREGFYITSLAVDSYNEGTIYLGLGVDTTDRRNLRDSDIAKSIDFGKGWETIYRIKAGSIASKILIDRNDTRVVYVATDNIGIFKTTDGGLNWEDITGEKQEVPKNKNDEFEQRFEKLIDFTKDIRAKVIDSLVFRDMILSPTEPNVLLHASNYGLLRSDDGGNTWHSIKLIVSESESKAIIYSLTAHPTKIDEFYYGTDDTLFKTSDGGQNWTTIKGPGSRAIYEILVTNSGKEDANVYVGVYNLKPPVPPKK